MAGGLKLLLTLSVCFRISLCSSVQRKLVIPKCCSIGEQFNESMACVKSDSTHEDWEWVLNKSTALNHRVRFSTLSPTISANTSLSCPPLSREILFHEMDEFHLLVRENGRLHLDVLVYSTQDRDQMMTYTESFCMDAATRIIVFCPCSKIPCVRKCCLDGFTFNVSLGRCVDTGDDDIGYWRPTFQAGSAEEGYYIVNRTPTCGAGTATVITSSNTTKFTVNGDGSVKVSGYPQVVPQKDYCGETGLLLVCPGSLRKEDRKFLVYGILLLIAGSLLFVSVVATGFLLPSKVATKLHNRFLTSHNAALAIAYIATGVAQILLHMTNMACISVAFIIQYTFLAAFLWLNVMCIDIAWAFSGLRPPQGSAMERDHKKFILYSVYAWGTTGIISIITATVEFAPGLADGSPLKPNFGRRACWFEKPAATFAYFYGPMAFLLVANLVLFLYTAARIISVKRDTAILNSAGNTSGSAIHKDRQRLVLYVKLFCLMGLTWVTEIISWAVGGAEYYWYITDIVNMLRAVFIFGIFCCKRSVLNLMRVRLASFLPCAERINHGKSGTSLSGPTSSLRITTSIKMSTRKPSQDT